MAENDPRPQLVDIAVALSLLTRLPLRLSNAAFDRSAVAAWAWPIVGAVVAGIGGVAALIGAGLGLGAPIAGLLALCAMIVATGAMHEDGLADCADGFFGGHDTARRLEIMKDSRIGTYGVAALVLSLLLRWQALAGFATLGDMIAALLAASVVSRAAIAAVMHGVANARAQGLSAHTGRPPISSVVIGASIAMLLAFFAIGWAALTVVICVAVVTVCSATLARAKVGGQTGDVLGAIQQLSEITALLAILAVA